MQTGMPSIQVDENLKMGFPYFVVLTRQQADELATAFKKIAKGDWMILAEHGDDKAVKFFAEFHGELAKALYTPIALEML